MRAKTKLHIERVCAIGDLLDKAPASPMEIAHELGITPTLAGRLTRVLHLGNYIHVHHWRRKPTHAEAYAPVYAPGPGEDAPHPKEAKKVQIEVESL